MVPDKNQMQGEYLLNERNITLLNVMEITINFNYCSFSSRWNTSTVSVRLSVFQFALGEGWRQFSKANHPLLCSPSSPTSSVHCLIKFPSNILTTTGCSSLNPQTCFIFLYKLLPQFSLASCLPKVLQRAVSTHGFYFLASHSFSIHQI